MGLAPLIVARQKLPHSQLNSLRFWRQSLNFLKVKIEEIFCLALQLNKRN